MRYLVVDNNNNIIGSKSGYKTIQLAKMGARNLSSPIFQAALEHARKEGWPPGGKFYAAVEQYIEEHISIVTISDIIYRTDDGRTIKTTV